MSVVLPEPRKPVMMVIGMGAMDLCVCGSVCGKRRRMKRKKKDAIQTDAWVVG